MATYSSTRNPVAFSITATTTPQSLYTLMSAVNDKVAKLAQVIRIQLDPGAGSTSLYCGNPDGTVSATNCGAALVAGQVWDLPSVSSNLYHLKDINLAVSTGTAQVNVTIVTR